jgi:hypothetical protein
LHQERIFPKIWGGGGTLLGHAPVFVPIAWYKAMERWDCIKSASFRKFKRFLSISQGLGLIRNAVQPGCIAYRWFDKTWCSIFNGLVCPRLTSHQFPLSHPVSLKLQGKP